MKRLAKLGLALTVTGVLAVVFFLAAWFLSVWMAAAGVADAEWMAMGVTLFGFIVTATFVVAALTRDTTPRD